MAGNEMKIEAIYNDKTQDSSTSIIDPFKRCQYFCKNKNRKCKLLARKDLPYCGEHIQFSDDKQNEDSDLKRVKCPLDPNHSVFEKNLEKHLKKCNAREIILGKFYVSNINSYSSDNDENDEIKLNEMNKFTIKDLNNNELNEFIDYLLELDNKLNLSKPLEMFDYSDQYIDEQLNANYTGALSTKHLKQISSMVSHIKNTLDLNDKSKSVCFIELGAGRGKLSHWLSLSMNSHNMKSTYLLVERGSQRYKFENQHDESELNTKFERLRMDIKNLYLSELDTVKSNDMLILYGKHLCGSATDYTLHCLKRTLSSNEKLNKFKGLLIALCCHHYCEWSSFCGKRYFKSLNLTSKQFYIIRNLTSWATCGQRLNHEHNIDETGDGCVVNGINKLFVKDEKKLFREKIGYICKNLIDFARINYLLELNKQNESFKLDAKLVYYCNQNITLENRMIIVSPVKKIN